MRSNMGASAPPWRSGSATRSWRWTRSRRRHPSMPAEASGGVLFVHAHPDDESMGTGGTIARLVAEGIRVDLVTCTDGAEGEIHDPTLDQDEARPRLAEIRAAELPCSVDALGGGAVPQHLLGYRDSGMIVTYDENGNYGPPDHINAARIARNAYQASAAEPCEVARFYEIAWIREHWT